MCVCVCVYIYIYIYIYIIGRIFSICVIPRTTLESSNSQDNWRLTVEFKYINQLDATISQVFFYYLTFMYSSTCFGRPRAHHQEQNNCSSSLWFYCWSVVVAKVLLVVVGPVNRPDHDHSCCCSLVTPEIFSIGAKRPGLGADLVTSIIFRS